MDDDCDMVDDRDHDVVGDKVTVFVGEIVCVPGEILPVRVGLTDTVSVPDGVGGGVMVCVTEKELVELAVAESEGERDMVPNVVESDMVEVTVGVGGGVIVAL